MSALEDVDVYAQALADVEDVNGYDLTACRAAYAHVCEAVTPGAGPGGAAAVAISVQLLRRRAERAEAERDQLREASGALLAALDCSDRRDIDRTGNRLRALLCDTEEESQTDTLHCEPNTGGDDA